MLRLILVRRSCKVTNASSSGTEKDPLNLCKHAESPLEPAAKAAMVCCIIRTCSSRSFNCCTAGSIGPVVGVGGAGAGVYDGTAALN